MGTPDFAVPALAALNEKYNVKAVVTVPDKPKGRGLQMQPSPVKVKAMELGIPVLQPEKLKDENFINDLKALNADIFVIIAFRILPKEVFNIPKIASFNIHGSLLPKYRGAAPINWAIINGDNITGLTSFILGEKVDTGNMLLQKILPIPEEFTAGDLHDALMPLSVELALDTCKLLIDGEYNAILQDESLATPAPKLFRETAKIDWNKPAEAVKKFIHGHSPIPGAWTTYEGKSLKILRAEFEPCSCSEPQQPAGSYTISKDGFKVFCATGKVFLKQIQPEGKKAMDVTQFLNGFRGTPEGKME